MIDGKLELEATIAAGGWRSTGPTATLSLGDPGPAVVVLRDRLIGMGYLRRSIQSAGPEAEFQRVLVTGAETSVPLQKAVPMHLVDFAAYPTHSGKTRYLREVYCRDAAILAALQAVGVVIPGVQG